MTHFDARQVAQRIDTVLDILVAGDYHSAASNLEILKAELLASVPKESAQKPDQPAAPWEI